MRSGRPLRILVISNLYPPHYIGGYELGCAEVVNALERRGHAVRVLTSTYGVGAPSIDEHAYRWLRADISVPSRERGRAVQIVRKEVVNLRAFDRAVSQFRPDVIYAWNMVHVSISLVNRARRRGYPVCLFVSDDWLARWETDLWHSRARACRWGWKRAGLGGLRALGLVEPSLNLDLSHVQFASRYLMVEALERGKRVYDAQVIHWGIDLRSYPFRTAPRQPLRLLFVGQVIPHKGANTAIQALKHMRDSGADSVSLTVAGGSVIPSYVQSIQTLVRELGLEDSVTFTGGLPREAVRDLYASHDVLIFPSVWDEPFSITLLEAMASGLGVVATLTGGTGEILRDGVNALAFPKEDAATCARQTLRLIRDTKLLEQIRLAARRTVESECSLDSMVDRIEHSLARACASGSSASEAGALRDGRAWI
jgi:glycogen(starch) synthase